MKNTNFDTKHLSHALTLVKVNKKFHFFINGKYHRPSTFHPCYFNIVCQSFPNHLPNHSVRRIEIVENLVVPFNPKYPKCDPSQQGPNSFDLLERTKDLGNKDTLFPL